MRGMPAFKRVLLSVACLALLAAVAALPTPAAAERPNIVLIVADDLGYGELGCQGNGEIPTPNIDSLARDGMRLTQAYVTAPVCCPSRAGLMTGRIQTRFGHELNAIGRVNLQPEVGLPLSEQTLADRLKAAGYATGLVGKWHLGGTAPYHPQRRGFGEFFGFLHEGHFYAPPPYRGVVSRLRPNEPPYDDANPLLRGEQAVEEEAYLTQALTREATAFIRRHEREPLFLTLAYNAPHSPMQAPTADVDRFTRIPELQRRLFAAMLSDLDDGVGAVLKELRERGLERRTLVVFLSDNGGPTAELTSSNKPLRGGKGQLYEGGIRIPFLLRWPERLPVGKVFDLPAISLDLVPTALAAAGVAIPKDAALDGVDLLPYLAGQAKARPHETLFWRYGASQALRQGDLKLVRQRDGARPPADELYDLARDPGETTNLAAQQPQSLARMRAAFDQLNAQMVPPRWGRMP